MKKLLIILLIPILSISCEKMEPVCPDLPPADSAISEGTQTRAYDIENGKKIIPLESSKIN